MHDSECARQRGLNEVYTNSLNVFMIYSKVYYKDQDLIIWPSESDFVTEAKFEF